MGALLLLNAALLNNASAQKPFTPSESELTAAYASANEFQKRATNATLNLNIKVNWIGKGDQFWYVRQTGFGEKEFVLVEASTGSRKAAFDHQRLASALSRETKGTVVAKKLPFDDLSFNESLTAVQFTIGSQRYNADLNTFEVRSFEPQKDSERVARAQGLSPDGKWTARLSAGQIEVKENEWTRVTKVGDFARFTWSPDSKKLLAFRLIPGDRQLVYLPKSSLPRRTRAGLESRLYDQPGDKLDTFETYVVDPVTKSEIKVDLDPIMGGGQPWAGPPNVRWWNGKAILEFPIRGYQEHRVVSIDPDNAVAKTLVKEVSQTFIDQSKTWLDLPSQGNELIWSSERSGWCHLYRVNADTFQATPITKGQWVVRSLERYDPATDRVWFTASGMAPGQDPYQVHYYTIHLDGTELTDLTPGDGMHSIQLSPDQKYLVDTYSRVNQAPIHELRSTDGRLISTLETADISQFLRNGVRLPEPFVAKGRDGKTDIYGIVIKPSNFDPKRKYPVIENIYAGPHDSFVPKSFRPFLNMHRLAELGFIVVQIDGMGTNNRGKAFHDVCWKNIADAGFPDRILWMKALARKLPQADITRVGIYGTSAGGQESAAGILFHPEFYKAAVSSCGCHDNRIDKQWWNEQWMGYPVGPHYDEQSNITNAAKLQGKLLLIVGENDRNVPPESTFRFADALIKANKDFDLVVIPGADHTDGGPYGEKKRRDFFVRWLHGTNPPKWGQ